MLFAGLAASAAIDLLSLLQTEKPKGGTGLTAQPAFAVPDPGAVEAAASQSQSGRRTDSLSRDALGTLLSAQGQAHAGQRKGGSISVLLELLQSSQNGSVKKSDLEAAAGESDGEVFEMFDRIDRNHDDAVSLKELSAFLDTYRRASEAGTQGRTRALAMVV